MTNKKELEKIFKQIKAIGVKEVYIETLNTSSYINNKLEYLLKDELDEVKNSYKAIKEESEEFNKLKDFLILMVEKYNFKLKYDNIIEH